jgi:hypothetical protein
VRQWSTENPEDRYMYVPAVGPDVTSTPAEKDLKNAMTEEDEEDAPSDTSSFFFCHQSKFQRHLLRR